MESPPPASLPGRGFGRPALCLGQKREPAQPAGGYRPTTAGREHPGRAANPAHSTGSKKAAQFSWPDSLKRHISCTSLVGPKAACSAGQRRSRTVNKAATRILIMIIILALAMMACVNGGGDGGSGGSGNDQSTSQQVESNSPDATAAYGAEQLHIQLTEIAREKKP